MPKMLLLFSHKLTPAQKEDAARSYGVDVFVALPDSLQDLWSNIPPQLENLTTYLEPLKTFLRDNTSENDLVLIQGDFGGCCEMVRFAKSLRLTVVHSTTRRNVTEETTGNRVKKISHFDHVIFRKY